MNTFTKILMMMSAILMFSCSDDGNEAVAQPTMSQKMYITIDGVSQPVTLYNNAATQALVAKLQEGNVTVSLNSSGGFEIWGALGFSLPTSNEQMTAHPGDVILYNGESNISVTLSLEPVSSGLSAVRMDISPQDDAYYNLNGQKVVNPSHGIYIKNGNKVIL